MASVDEFGSDTTSAVSLLQRIDIQRLSPLIQRILQKFDIGKNEAVFSQTETSKLASAIGCEPSDIENLIAFIRSIYERAVYAALKPATLEKQLVQGAQLDAERAAVFAANWQAVQKRLINEAKQKLLSSSQLETVDWRLNLALSSPNAQRLKKPTALFEFKLHNDVPDVRGNSDSFLVEFDHESLAAFFQQLESIQLKLDALS